MKNISHRIGHQLRWTSATWITVFGGLLAMVGIPLFLAGHDWWAILVLTISFLTDWWDGCVARYHQGNRAHMTRKEESRLSIWGQLNYRGVTHLGRSIDPLVDKIRFLGLLWSVGYGIVDAGVMILLAIMAIGLTLARLIKDYFKLDHGGSNRWGKMKVYAEVILIVVLVFGTRPLYGGSNPLAMLSITRIIIDAMSLVTVVLSCASAWGHLETGYLAWYTRRSS